MKSISYEIPGMLPTVQVRRLCLTESYQTFQRTIVPAVVLCQRESLPDAVWEGGLDSWRLHLEQRKREEEKLQCPVHVLSCVASLCVPLSLLRLLKSEVTAAAHVDIVQESLCFKILKIFKF
jgi:hypothetical protein